MILHVRDISHPETEGQHEEVLKIMDDLGVAQETPVIEVWNKADLLPAERMQALLERADREKDIFATSALTGQGLPEMLTRLSEVLSPARTSETLFVPYSAGRVRAWLHDKGLVETETPEESGYRIDVVWTERQKARFAQLSAASG